MGDELLTNSGRGSIVLGLSTLHRFVFMGSGESFAAGGSYTVFHNGVHSDHVQARFVGVCVGRPLYSYKMMNRRTNVPRR